MTRRGKGCGWPARSSRDRTRTSGQISVCTVTCPVSEGASSAPSWTTSTGHQEGRSIARHSRAHGANATILGGCVGASTILNMSVRACRAEWLLPLLLIASCETISPASTVTSAPSPKFEQHACTVPNVDAALAARMRCGTVRVPRNYAHPDGPSFALSVVVIGSEQKPALPDPVVYINGGPGEPITVYAAAQAKTPYAPGRDLVLIDQRGTGESEPRICPTMDRKLLDATLLLAEGGVSAADARRAAFDACRREALSRGIDLSDFGTRVTANDFESVRRALNIARWNLYGESYGTDVAMTLAALHPATVRSMVLDSMYPPDPRPSRATSVAAARKAFFALCDSDPSCFGVSGGLARAYDEAKAQLARDPLTLTRPPGSEWSNERFVLTARGVRTRRREPALLPQCLSDNPTCDHVGQEWRARAVGFGHGEAL